MTVIPLRSPAALLDHLGIEQPADIDIEAIAQYCGATVIYDRVVGADARLVGVGERAIITVSKDLPRPRQRFSAAHELGHWIFDRGMTARVCEGREIEAGIEQHAIERRANQYAVELLMPRRMFRRMARQQPITFATVRRLADEFCTSLTATAIRLVDLGSFPAMLVKLDRDGRRWYARNHLVSPEVVPLEYPGDESSAFWLMHGADEVSGGPRAVAATQWVGHPAVRSMRVTEDSLSLAGDEVLTLLWWHDDEMIIQMDDGVTI